MKKTKKKPEDYPLLSFRLTGYSEKQRAELNGRIDKIIKVRRNEQADEERMISKGDVLTNALELGLRLLERKHLKGE